MRAFPLVLVLVLVAGSNDSRADTDAASPSPSDDPAAYDAAFDADPASRSFAPTVSPPRFVVPSSALPARSAPLASNNNCAIVLHEGRLFLAWRTAPTHFASAEARMEVVSSADGGASWAYEMTVALGADVREPAFVALPGRPLLFQCFEGGTDPLGFEPRRMWRSIREGPARWSKPAAFGEPGEVPWDVKVRGGRAWMTSYRGAHYGATGGGVDVHFKTSADGLEWTHVDPAKPVVYRGGVSEVAFEFDRDGTLFAITRNEDGDASGFGSHLVTAPPGSLAAWAFPARSNPERFDSPEMFRHGDDLYLVARRDLGGPFDMGLDWLSFEARRWTYLAAYSARPKRTALYRIDRAARAPVALLDLPGNGDTAFPSIARTGAHSFLLANYTSPLGNPDRAWMHGQVSPEGSRIYLVDVIFRTR